MPTINMLSTSMNVKGEGVTAAYYELLSLVKSSLSEDYEVTTHEFKMCDIMHYHTIDFKFFLSIPFSKIKGTTVAYVHFLPETVDESINLPWLFKKVFYNYIIWFYKSVNHLVVVNPLFKEKLMEYNIPGDKITFIPNYVSHEGFFAQDDKTIIETKKRLGIDENKFVVLGVGQVQNRKGVLDFVEVAKKKPEVQFIWAGGFSFGNITDGYQELKKVVASPPSNVKFLGIIDRENMNDIYNISDLLFLPSYNELFPMAILEAMNLKLPLLLRDIDVYPGILFDYYAKGSNNEEFAERIQSISEDKAIYKHWSDKSWQGNMYYSKEHISRLWNQFYKRIYSERLLLKYRRHIDGTNS